MCVENSHACFLNQIQKFNYSNYKKRLRQTIIIKQSKTKNDNLNLMLFADQVSG